MNALPLIQVQFLAMAWLTIPGRATAVLLPLEQTTFTQTQHTESNIPDNPGGQERSNSTAMTLETSNHRHPTVGTIEQHISFEFVRKRLRNSYRENGRPSIGPPASIAILLIGTSSSRFSPPNQRNRML